MRQPYPIAANYLHGNRIFNHVPVAVRMLGQIPGCPSISGRCGAKHGPTLHKATATSRAGLFFESEDFA